jgi:molybdopterin-containing oxidoreductase family membrane subunit
MATLVSVYDMPSDVATVVRKLKARGFEDLTTYAPAPFEEIEEAEDPKPSAVRAFTLIGGLVGVVTGFGIQIWMSMDWPIKIAGKNIAAIPPMWIVGFELTILFGGILTVIGLLILGGLYPRPLDEHYSPRFSATEFGVVVKCEERDVAEVESLMRGHNAKEVTLAASH